jgi:hypothetical protein
MSSADYCGLALTYSWDLSWADSASDRDISPKSGALAVDASHPLPHACTLDHNRHYWVVSGSGYGVHCAAMARIWVDRSVARFGYIDDDSGTRLATANEPARVSGATAGKAR